MNTGTEINRKDKKQISYLLISMLVFSLLFSAVYAAIESGHDCTGEECPICFSLIQCEEIIRLLKITVILLLTTFFTQTNSVRLVNKPAFCLCELTPISLKVQLNN